MTDDSDLRATAVHEAGHAIVMWSLHLSVHAVAIREDDQEGSADILDGSADGLSLVDHIAVCAAGMEAETIFQSPTHDGAHYGDLRMILKLLKKAPKHRRDALCNAGFARAHEILVMHQSKVARLAKRLLEVHPIDAAEFVRLMS